MQQPRNDLPSCTYVTLKKLETFPTKYWHYLLRTLCLIFSPVREIGSLPTYAYKVLAIDKNIISYPTNICFCQVHIIPSFASLGMSGFGLNPLRSRLVTYIIWNVWEFLKPWRHLSIGINKINCGLIDTNMSLDWSCLCVLLFQTAIVCTQCPQWKILKVVLDESWEVMKLHALWIEEKMR